MVPQYLFGIFHIYGNMDLTLKYNHIPFIRELVHWRLFPGPGPSLSIWCLSIEPTIFSPQSIQFSVFLDFKLHLAEIYHIALLLTFNLEPLSCSTRFFPLQPLFTIFVSLTIGIIRIYGNTGSILKYDYILFIRELVGWTSFPVLV